jgi:ribosome-associated toxin RatA of RatAB toxin-antitoxin module
VKELQGRASGEVDAAPEECFELLAAVDRYPAWFKVVRTVEILEPERNGTPALARAAVHVKHSPFGQDFDLLMAVRTEPPVIVTMTRLPNGPTDPDRLGLTWRVEIGRPTQLEFEFEGAASFVPAFFPVGDAGDAIARAAVEAARDALSR